MSRTHHSRKPRRPRASTAPIAVVHYRVQPENERSACGAEERASFCGETVIATSVVAEVTCSLCRAWIQTPEARR